ncbi:MAG TPA: hypothetical protein VK013_13190 [Myxococcaceae bacterium]|nr:hypothetical protein [Myxococcaceae bacterium]
MNPQPRLLGLPVLILLLACGGPAPELGLGGPSTAEAIWGSATSLKFTLERNETATGEVTLSIEGLPAGVNARFEPATLSGDALASTLHLETARDAAGGVFMVTVHASGGDEPGATHVFALDVGGLTVEGQVVTVSGEALTPGLLVKVGSRRVATDAEGYFVAHEVAVPYDLVVSGGMITEIYTGFTTATPRVEPFYDVMAGPGSEELLISGTITPTPASGERVSVCSSATRAFASVCTTVEGDGSRNTYQLSMPGGREQDERPRLIARREVLDGGGRTAGFNGYAEAAIPDGAAPGRVVDLVLESSSSTAFTFSVDRGSATLQELDGRVSYGAFLNGASSLSPDVFHLPEGAQGSILAVISDEVSVSSLTVQPVTGPLESPITFATPMPLISPAEGATLTAGSEFVTGPPDGQLVSHTFLTPEGLVVVHTFEDRVRLADVSTYVEGLGAGDIGVWLVTTSPGVESPEQALEETVGYMGMLMLSAGIVGKAPRTEPLRMAFSGIRSFAAAVAPLNAPSPLLDRFHASLMR